MQNKTIKLLEEWAVQLPKHMFDEVYVFGSLITSNGEGFDVQSYQSDVDILITFKSHLNSIERLNAMKEFRQFKLDLEVKLVQHLELQEANRVIVSVLWVTNFEIQGNIHKGNAPNFFETPIFYNLISKEKKKFENFENFKEMMEKRDLIQILQEVQEMRNKYFSFGLNNVNTLKDHTGVDVCPKGISRMAGILSVYADEGGSDEDRCDIAQGTLFLINLVKENEKISSEFEELSSVLLSRVGRGKRSILIDQLLLLWEALFDQVVFLLLDQKEKEQRLDVLSDDKEYEVNCFKLFYRRYSNGHTVLDIVNKTGIPESTILQIEQQAKLTRCRSECSFVKLAGRNIKLISEAIDCNVGDIVGGKLDDFQTNLIIYYERYYSSQDYVVKSDKPSFDSKIVVFDFDGTLTKTENMAKTTWENIWISLGYSVNDCHEYHTMFADEKISHQEWCDITTEKFRARDFSQSQLIKIAANTKLINGVGEVFQTLSNHGIKIYVLSGSIDLIIKTVLRDFISYISDISSNIMHFDSKGIISSIDGTKYDFEGKAVYIEELACKLNVDPTDILFIGNDQNDEHVYLSGAKTLVINPQLTKPASDSWHYSVRDLDDLNEVVEYVLPSLTIN